MASADIAKELNSQLKAKGNNDASEADKISVVESNVDAAKCESSGEKEKPKKRKEGFLKRIRNVVKAPLRRKQKSGVRENGKSSQRTKSTSDLADAQEEHDTEATHEHDSKAKHGIAGLFGRQLKIRTSWKKKMLKKDEALSEPGSPAHSHQLPSSSAKQIDSKEREELATINKTLADDSFFQISLTNDTLNSSALSDAVVALGDFDGLEANTSGLSQQSIAQDRIRLAPKGRRKPTRFATSTDASDKITEEKEVSTKNSAVATKMLESMAVEEVVKSNVAEPAKNEEVKKVTPSVPKNPPTAEKPKIVAKKPMLPIKKSPRPDPIKTQSTPTSEDKKPQSELSEIAVSTEEFGANGNKDSPSNESALASKDPGEKEDASEKASNTDGMETAISTAKIVAEKENSNQKEDSDEKEESNETDVQKIGGQDILDLIEGKTGRSSEVPNVSKEKENLQVNGSDAFGINGFSSPREEEEKAADDDSLAKIRRFSKEQENESEESKPSLKFHAEQVSISKSNTEKSWSFQLYELDDMRSADMKPKQFQRSKSMSAAQKPSSHATLVKSTSIDGGLTYAENEIVEETETASKSGKLPDWVAIAKAKHQKNAPDDDESLEDTMEDIQEIAAQIARNETSSPEAKGKPSTLSSRIPKPAFKSQSLKHPSPTQAPSTNLKSRNTISSRVTSPTSTCLVCTKPAYQFERCDVDGYVMHKNCAKCSMCSRTINVGTIRVINSKLYCGIHARTAAS